MYVIYVVAAVTAGIALDWSLFQRFKVILGVFGDQDEVRYRDLPLWRFFLIVIASTMIGIHLTFKDIPHLLFWAGVVLFLLLNIYAIRIAVKRWVKPPTKVS